MLGAYNDFMEGTKEWKNDIFCDQLLLLNKEYSQTGDFACLI